MADYNFQFNLQGNEASNDAFTSKFAPFAPVLGQSADWIIPGYPPLGLVGGNTAAQPYPELDSAPFMAAVSGGRPANFSSTLLAKSTRRFSAPAAGATERLFPLTRHIKETTEPQQYECPCCENSPVFKRLDHVKKHLRSEHRVHNKTAIDALMRLQRATPAPPKASRHRKAAGAVVAANPISVPATTSSAAPFPVQGLAGQSGLPTVPTGGFQFVSTPGFFPVPATGLAADPTGFPAPPMRYLDASMTGFVVAPAAEAAADFVGDDVLEEFGFMDGMWFQ